MTDFADGLPDDVLELLRSAEGADRLLDPLPNGVDQALAAKLSATLGIPVAAVGIAAAHATAATSGTAATTTGGAAQAVAASSAASSAIAPAAAAAAAGKLGLAALVGKPIVIAALVVGAGAGVLSTLAVGALQRAGAPAVVAAPAPTGVAAPAPAARAPVAAPPAPTVLAAPVPAGSAAPAPPTAAEAPQAPVAIPKDAWQLEEPAADVARPAHDPAAERRLVEAARAALQQGDVAAAGRALQEHRRRFPRGAFVEERHALSAIAAAQAGDPRAADIAQAFRARFPASLFAPAVDAALAR